MKAGPGFHPGRGGKRSKLRQEESRQGDGRLVIKSDRWIIRMAQEKRMIEPFEAETGAKWWKLPTAKPVSPTGFPPMGTTFVWRAISRCWIRLPPTDGIDRPQKF